INTILGAFRALANKAASLTPTDLTSGGATFNNMTDSLEAFKDATGSVSDVRDAILSDSTPFAGANVAGIKSKTDSLTFTQSGKVDANVLHINSSANAAARLALSAAEIIPGTVDAGSFTPTTSAFESDDITSASADVWNNSMGIFTSGA